MPNLITLVDDFTGDNGTNNGPQDGALIMDADGDLFGTTLSGGAFDNGSVFEIVNNGTVADPSYASAHTTLFSFNGTTGTYAAAPYSGLIADAKGDLFGTTGGNSGSVFELVNNGTVAHPSYTSAPIILASFNGTDPLSGLLADAKGDLFGTTYHGGANNDGTVFEIVNNGTVAAPSYASTPTTLATFSGTNGANPLYGSLIADANGDLFGTTNAGGANGYGTVFEIVKTGQSYASVPTTLVSFNGTNGASPLSGLVADANGDLFGTTSGEGTSGSGTVFEIVNDGTVAAPSYASAPTILVTFNGTDGATPASALIVDAKGDLFGTTVLGGTGGGPAGKGTVFEIVNNGTVAAPSYASTPTTLISFNGTNGANPYSALTVDAKGDLFGTTMAGGANNDGTVFEITDSGFVPFASPPTVTDPTATQFWSPGQTIDFTLPANTFTDPQGETLTYAATLSSGAALPSWLHFNSATDTFTGTVPIAATALDIEVTATDTSGLSASETFAVLPRLRLLPWLSSLLPSWLHFNGTTDTSTATGLHTELMATDPGGFPSSPTFAVPHLQDVNASSTPPLLSFDNVHSHF